MLKIFPDLESLSQAAAALTAAQAGAAIKARGRFVVALAGGGTPARTYELLAQAPLRDQVAWEAVHFFWGDERCVPPEDPLSNYRLAHRALLSRVPVRPAQIHPLLCREKAEAASRAYEAMLRRAFAEDDAGFDLALLGLGADGHTASLFPGEEPPPGRWVAPVKRRNEPFWRLTLTPEVFNRSRLVVFLVSGADKAWALGEVLGGPEDPLRLPARRIRPASGEVRWLVDRAAAARLDPRLTRA